MRGVWNVRCFATPLGRHVRNAVQVLVFFSISVGTCWNQPENMMPKVGALVNLRVCARCRVMDLFFCNLIHV